MKGCPGGGVLRYNSDGDVRRPFLQSEDFWGVRNCVVTFQGVKDFGKDFWGVDKKRSRLCREKIEFGVLRSGLRYVFGSGFSLIGLILGVTVWLHYFEHPRHCYTLLLYITTPVGRDASVFHSRAVALLLSPSSEKQNKTRGGKSPRFINGLREIGTAHSLAPTFDLHAFHSGEPDVQLNNFSGIVLKS